MYVGKEAAGGCGSIHGCICVREAQSPRVKYILFKMLHLWAVAAYITVLLHLAPWQPVCTASPPCGKAGEGLHSSVEMNDMCNSYVSSKLCGLCRLWLDGCNVLLFFCCFFLSA